MNTDASSLVTVIVPTYNTEKYLDQCLTSIRNQTHRNLEIICINDGSTDGSLDIMRRHESEDRRVIVIDKSNGGYGAACNRGIQEAHGEWVAIVEPDDWIESGMYGEMLAFAAGFKEKVDVIKTPWWTINDWDRPEDLQSRSRCPLALRVSRSVLPFRLHDCPALIEHHPSIWTALYRREFLNDFKIRFPEYPGAGWADNPFLIETLCQARSIVYLDRAFYCYRADLPGSTRNHSTEAAVRLPFDRWSDMMGILERLGVDDPVILEAHYMRGFMYVEGAIYDDGADNQIVREGMRRVFEAMDYDIVMDSVKVSGKRKRMYCQVLGLEYRPSRPLASALHSVRERGIYTRTIGLRGVACRLRFKLTGRR